MLYRPVNLEPGENLGESHGLHSGHVGLKFDADGNLVGHAVWQKVEEDNWAYEYHPDEPESQSQDSEAADALAAALVLLAITVGPTLVEWVALKAGYAHGRIQEKIRARRLSRAKKSGVPAPTPKNAASVAEAEPTKTALERATVTMTAKEWAARHEAMLAAAKFSDDQRRMLSVARVVESAGAQAQQLTAQQFSQVVQLQIEANPAVLEFKTAQKAAGLASTAYNKRGAAPTLHR